MDWIKLWISTIKQINVKLRNWKKNIKINLMLKDEIEKKINLKNLLKLIQWGVVNKKNWDNPSHF
jgi:hypothetical protein